ncbi:ATP-grasp domain-containing protein [Sulfurimonas sp. HSL3-7]|uniref:ATP-grasp domain-containing protein n=1 Tax=Sulfonitrofixus jiaomeiensis TaxID=3131938 RepID=UPI0031F83325
MLVSDSLECDRKVGIWMYQNSGGPEIEQKLILKLLERGINSVTGLDLRFAEGSKEGIHCKGLDMTALDAFFSYNAGEQTVAQVYMYQVLSEFIPTLNNFRSFAIAEDKFQSNMMLAKAGVRTPDFYLCHKEDMNGMVDQYDEWGKMVYKPIDGWGGNGMALIENRVTLDTLLPFINKSDARNVYVERFIKNDYSDFRVDIVDGEFVACYGRKAGGRDWRTNITSGGSVILREANDEIVELAKRATKAIGLEIAGVDILYDEEKEEYVVLEVNGIPAFATPEQEAMGLDFNDKKIDLIVNMIDRITKK